MIWIKNVHVIDPATRTEQDMDICIEDGIISGMGNGSKSSRGRDF